MRILPHNQAGAIPVPISPTPAPTVQPTPTPTPDTTPPNVVITNPLNGSTIKKSSTVNITANASDSGGIAKVEFYVNGLIKCTDTASLYSCSWNVPKQPRVTYNITVKAYDNQGLVGTNQITVYRDYRAN